MWFLALLMGLVACAHAYQEPDFDLIVYGTSSAAVVAAFAAYKHDMNVLLISPATRLGGMTTGGLSHTDTGDESTIGGMARDFYKQVGERYGLKKEVYNFEPSVALSVFDSWMERASDRITVKGNCSLTQVYMKNTAIISHAFFNCNSSVQSFSASQWIDASYEGDLMALSNVLFTIGREGSVKFNESLAGVTNDAEPDSGSNNQIDVPVDPWVRFNDSSSGLLPGIDGVWDPEQTPLGSSDQLVQSNNYRLCVTTNQSILIPFYRPTNYNSADYDLYARFYNVSKPTSMSSLFNMQPLPNHKYDLNNGGGLSTDLFHSNLALAYVNAQGDTRDKIQKIYTDFTKGLLYYMTNDPNVPAALRKSMSEHGYCGDEFVDSNYFPEQLYVREARRMLGMMFLTQHDIDQTNEIEDPVALGSYNMDSHNGQRLAVWDDAKKVWMTRNEGNIEVKPQNGPYQISYSSMVPRVGAVSNLIVPVCLSASHMAFASIRMEPVYMMLGHAAGVAAAMANQEDVVVQNVDRKALVNTLIKEGAILSIKQIKQTNQPSFKSE